jgi:N-acetylglutamate synthase-like GNAT family acetyltransferase
MIIRKCTKHDVEMIYEIINEAAQVYKGVIPEDRWHEPYMPREELRDEIQAGVEFWGIEQDGQLVGVMGIQDRGDVTLIRHSYVRALAQKKGIGTELLSHLEKMSDKPVLIGTWADALWAISFYTKNGYTLLSRAETVELLGRYWSIPERQVTTSVVLADRKWMRSRQDPPGRDGDLGLAQE